jgi:hypothetical protein
MYAVVDDFLVELDRTAFQTLAHPEAVTRYNELKGWMTWTKDTLDPATIDPLYPATRDLTLAAGNFIHLANSVVDNWDKWASGGNAPSSHMSSAYKELCQAYENAASKDGPQETLSVVLAAGNFIVMAARLNTSKAAWGWHPGANATVDQQQVSKAYEELCAAHAYGSKETAGDFVRTCTLEATMSELIELTKRFLDRAEGHQSADIPVKDLAVVELSSIQVLRERLDAADQLLNPADSSQTAAE